jgi:hypothetical protein
LTADVKDRPDSFVRREIEYALNRASVPVRESTPVVLPIVFPKGELPVHIANHTAIIIDREAAFEGGIDELAAKLEMPFEELARVCVPREPVR